MAGRKTGKRCAPEGKQLQYAVIRVRLYPTGEQAELIEKTFGCCRYLWNQMLADVQEFYAATDLQFVPTPARYKKEAPFLTEVDSQCLCAVHQNLRRAFLDFFKNPAAFRYPKFKTKKSRRESFTTYCRQLPSGPTVYLTGEGVRLPKLGVVKAKLHRRPLHWWSLRFATVSKTRTGKYFCSLTFGYEAKVPKAAKPSEKTTLALQYSPAHFYVDSEGCVPVPPDQAGAMERLAKMQRKLRGMERGSKNYEKQLQKIRLLHERIANRRKDFIHKESRRIANDWDAVCVKDNSLLGGAGSGFGMFRTCLQYKLERQGKRYIAVSGPAAAAEEIKQQGMAQLCA